MPKNQVLVINGLFKESPLGALFLMKFTIRPHLGYLVQNFGTGLCNAKDNKLHPQPNY